MSAAVEITRHTGPIRIRVSGTEGIKARIASVPIRVNVLGTPGPTGPRGDPGPQGLQGPMGDIAVGLPLDGGNF